MKVRVFDPVEKKFIPTDDVPFLMLDGEGELCCSWQCHRTGVIIDGVVQCKTPWKDDLGKDIYIGDILLINEGESKLYVEEHALADLAFILEDFEESFIEVVGNGCENPELLRAMLIEGYEVH